jgi:hypothetical protein
MRQPIVAGRRLVSTLRAIESAISRVDPKPSELAANLLICGIHAGRSGRGPARSRAKYSKLPEAGSDNPYLAWMLQSVHELP